MSVFQALACGVLLRTKLPDLATFSSRFERRSAPRRPAYAGLAGHQSGLESAEDLIKGIEKNRIRKQGRPTRTGEEEFSFESSDLPEISELWRWATMDQLADVQGGIQKQPKRVPKHNSYPYLRVANVLRGRLDLAEIHRMELFAGELKTYHLEPNDLLSVEGNGSLSEIGRSALWTGAIEN